MSLSKVSVSNVLLPTRSEQFAFVGGFTRREQIDLFLQACEKGQFLRAGQFFMFTQKFLSGDYYEVNLHISEGPHLKVSGHCIHTHSHAMASSLV